MSYPGTASWNVRVFHHQYISKTLPLKLPSARASTDLKERANQCAIDRLCFFVQDLCSRIGGTFPMVRGHFQRPEGIKSFKWYTIQYTSAYRLNIWRYFFRQCTSRLCTVAITRGELCNYSNNFLNATKKPAQFEFRYCLIEFPLVR